jgi:YVTN family beta-propeller protein
MRPTPPAAALLSGALLATAPAAAQRPGDLLLVLNKNAAEAVLLDATTGARVASMPTGPFPHEVTVSPDGRLAVVADYGAEQAGNTLTVLDLVARVPLRTIDLGEYRRPHGIVWLPGAGRRVAVTSEQSRNVVLVDVDRGRVETAIPSGQPGTHMIVLSRDGRRAYTANIAGGTVTMIDLGTRRAAKTVRTGRGPEAIDVSPDGREVWAADRTLNYVTVLDAATLDSLASMPTGAFPNRLKFTPDGRWALVSNASAHTLSIYDAKARALAATVPFPGEATPLGILVSPDGRRAWVATSARREIAEVDLEARRVVRTLTTGDTPDGMAYVSAPSGR